MPAAPLSHTVQGVSNTTVEYLPLEFCTSLDALGSRDSASSQSWQAVWRRLTPASGRVEDAARARVSRDRLQQWEANATLLEKETPASGLFDGTSKRHANFATLHGAVLYLVPDIYTKKRAGTGGTVCEKESEYAPRGCNRFSAASFYLDKGKGAESPTLYFRKALSQLCKPENALFGVGNLPRPA